MWPPWVSQRRFVRLMAGTSASIWRPRAGVGRDPLRYLRDSHSWLTTDTPGAKTSFVPDQGRLVLSGQMCRPRQRPCAGEPRSSPVARQAEPCASSFRLRQATGFRQFKDPIDDAASTAPGLSDLRAQGPRQRLVRCAPPCATGQRQAGQRPAIECRLSPTTAVR